jgi:hypothetical protein
MATRQLHNLTNAPDEVVIGSFRYYLGRKTYAVGTYCNWLRGTLHILDSIVLDLMQREIQEAIDRGCAGMECDVQDWDNVLRAIAVEKTKRGVTRE